jgi:hypothetical protein
MTPHLYPPPQGADRGRYFICIAFSQLPSPLMGEGSGGGEASAPSPHPNLPRKGGRGIYLALSAPPVGEDEHWVAV